VGGLGQGSKAIREGVGERTPFGVFPAEVDDEELDTEACTDVEAFAHGGVVDGVVVAPGVEGDIGEALVRVFPGEDVVDEAVTAVGELIEVAGDEPSEASGTGERGAGFEDVVRVEGACDPEGTVAMEVAGVAERFGVGLPAEKEAGAVGFWSEGKPGGVAGIARVDLDAGAGTYAWVVQECQSAWPWPMRKGTRLRP